MKFKKMILLILAFALLTVSAACSSKDKGSSKNDGDSKKESAAEGTSSSKGYASVNDIIDRITECFNNKDVNGLIDMVPDEYIAYFANEDNISKEKAVEQLKDRYNEIFQALKETINDEKALGKIGKTVEFDDNAVSQVQTIFGSGLQSVQIASIQFTGINSGKSTEIEAAAILKFNDKLIGFYDTVRTKTETVHVEAKAEANQ